VVASPQAIPQQRTVAPIECRADGDSIIISVIRGKPSLADSQRALSSFKALTSKMDRPVWISDATGLEGYEKAALSEGRNWFAAFKARGGRHVILVSQWSIAMMAARAMGFGFGVRITNEPTMAQALIEARRLRRTGDNSLFP
jgi:hypothetical protein